MYYIITFIGDLGAYTLNPIRDHFTFIKVRAGFEKAGIPYSYNIIKEGE